MLASNFLAYLITLSIAFVWLRINDFFAQRKWISSRLSRKIIHIGTGPIFVSCWILFPENYISRFLAASIPALITIQFILIGLEIIKDQASIDAMSRSGDPKEILYGPVFYGVIFTLVTLIYWKNSPIGITALMLMCGGDGLADLLGRKYGHTKLPWNPNKSWVGTISMLMGSYWLSVLILSLFKYFYYPSRFQLNIILFVLPISIIATIVESLKIEKFDNITITLAALICGHVWLYMFN